MIVFIVITQRNYYKIKLWLGSVADKLSGTRNERFGGGGDSVGGRHGNLAF